MKAIRMPRGRDDRHQRRAQVPEEDQADQGDHRELFQQLVLRLSMARSISCERS
jgi:hypothetical protein